MDRSHCSGDYIEGKGETDEILTPKLVESKGEMDEILTPKLV